MIKDFKSEVLPSGIRAEKYFGWNALTIINEGVDEFGEKCYGEVTITADDAARIYGIFNPTKRLSDKCREESSQADSEPEETIVDVDHVDVALFI